MQFHLLYYRNRSASNISDAKWIINCVKLLFKLKFCMIQKECLQLNGKGQIVKKKKNVSGFLLCFENKTNVIQRRMTIPKLQDKHLPKSSPSVHQPEKN